MNKIGTKLFGIAMAGFGGFLVAISVKEVMASRMDIFPVNFIIFLIGGFFLFFGIILLISKGALLTSVPKISSKGMSKRSIASLFLALAVTGIFWFVISSHADRCTTNFGPNASAGGRGGLSGCVCQYGYWLSTTTHSCVPVLAICEENDISSVSAAVKSRPNYDEYVQCKSSDGATREIDRGSIYPYRFK